MGSSTMEVHNVVLCVFLVKLIFDEFQSMQYGHYNQGCQA
jgi:hypothetical protein